MAERLHGFVLALVSVPALASVRTGSELDRLRAVKAEIEMIKGVRAVKCNAARAHFEACRRDFLVARQMQPSGSLSGEVLSALDESVSLREVADQALQDVNLASRDVDLAIAEFNASASPLVSYRRHGYALSLCSIRALTRPKSKQAELARLLVLKKELESLRAHRWVVQNRARLSLEEQEETVRIARHAGASGGILAQAELVADECRVVLSRAVIQSEESLIMLQDVDQEIAHCRSLVAAEA